MEEPIFGNLRNRMVEWHLIPRGISQPELLEAMRVCPRHLFVPEHYRSFAYEDTPLPIGEGQTISQPYIVARMIQAAHIDPTHNVLEIGTGSGYNAAILSHLAKSVTTIERIVKLAEYAKVNLQNYECKNVTMIVGDGSKGYEQNAPYDAIIITAAVDEVPKELLKQLAIGGYCIVPVGRTGLFEIQELLSIKKISEENFIKEHLNIVRFVPLIKGDQ